MNRIFGLILLFMSITHVYAETIDYRVSDGKFITSEGDIPNGCFAQLMTELNGDDSTAAVFIHRTWLRGCMQANNSYPGGIAEDISYTISESLENDTYEITVCQAVSGSLKSSCDNIVIKFSNRNYLLPTGAKTVLSLEKLGRW